MADREQLVQRYRDLLNPDADGDLPQMVARLDEAATPIRSLEPPQFLDHAVQQLTRQRQAPSLNGKAVETVGIAPPEHASAPSSLPTRLRTGWLRQALGMVAGILVLVLVAGVLSTVFRSQGQSHQGGLGSGATATTGPGLPMTVTAHGFPVTLESVEVGSNTIFHFTVKLPSDLAATPELNVLDTDRSPYVRVDGLATGPHDPIMHVEAHTPGDPLGKFSIIYSSIPSPNQTVTFTLRRLPFTATPRNLGAIQGPWTFVLTPEVLAAKPLPTPSAYHSYFPITVAEARRLVDFPIIEPTPLPGMLLTAGSDVMASVLKPATGDKPNYVVLNYRTGDHSVPGVTVEETTNKTVVPTSPPTALVGPGSTTPVPVTESSKTEVPIHGVMVTRLESVQGDTDFVAYTWEQSGVYCVVYASVGQQLTDAVLKQMVNSIIDQESGSATPDSTGQSTITFEQAQQAVQFHLVRPSWLPSYLIPDGVDTVPHSDPTHPPIPIHAVTLYYGQSDPGQHDSLQILEHDGNFAISSPPGAATTLSIGGHDVSWLTSAGGTLTYFTLQDQGTTFQITAQMTGPLTEQDVERVIASMLDQRG